MVGNILHAILFTATTFEFQWSHIAVKYMVKIPWILWRTATESVRKL